MADIVSKTIDSGPVRDMGFQCTARDLAIILKTSQHELADRIMMEIAATLKCQPNQAVDRVAALIEHVDGLQRKIADAKKELGDRG